MKENNEKKMKDEDEISKLIKAFPKDIAQKYKSFPMLKITIITMKLRKTIIFYAVILLGSSLIFS